MAGAGVVELTDTNFEETIKNSKSPVLVDFWATWCAPCRRIAPIIDELAGEYNGRVVVAKVDIDNNQEVTLKHGVQSIPTLMIFKDGQLQERLVGAHPKQTLVDTINRFI